MISIVSSPQRKGMFVVACHCGFPSQNQIHSVSWHITNTDLTHIEIRHTTRLVWNFLTSRHSRIDICGSGYPTISRRIVTM
jgi:hypothetical protein